MKIKKLELSNFKNHEKTEIVFDKINIFIGEIGEGKSSIVDAISTAINGETPTKPTTDYIKIGKTESTIICELEKTTSFTFTRRLSSTTETIDNCGLTTPALHTRLGTTKALIKTLLNSWHFVTDADSKDRQSILTSVLMPSLDKAELKELILNNVTLYKDQYDTLVENNFDNLSSKKSQIEALYAIVYANRRTIKKQITDFESRIKSFEDALSSYSNLPTDEIDQETLDRTIKHGMLLQSSEKLENEISTIEKDNTIKSSKISEILSKISNLETVLQESGLKDPEKEHKELSSKISIIESHLRGIKANIAKLPLATSKEEIPCPYFEYCRYDKILTEIDSVKEKLSENITTKTLDLEKANKQYTEYEELAKTKKLVDELRQVVNSAKNKIESEQSNITEKKTSVEKIKEEIKDLVSKGIVDKSKISNNEAKTKIAELKANISSIRISIETEQTSLLFNEHAISAFEDTTTWSNLLSTNKDKFIETLESICKILIPKYDVCVSPNMEMTFTGISINTLSTSEKFRVGLAVQTALAIVSKLGIIVVDGSDIVTNSDIVVDAVNTISTIPGIDNIIILSSIDILNGGKKSKLKVPFKGFKVSDGKVINLEAW